MATHPKFCSRWFASDGATGEAICDCGLAEKEVLLAEVERLKAALRDVARQFHASDRQIHRDGSWTHCDNRWCVKACAALEGEAA